MQFTLGQLRETVGLVETYRHWKRVLPPFVDRKGVTLSFSAGDLLAVTILHRLTATCGVRVGRLSDISGELVRLCNASPWAALRGRVLAVDVQKNRCSVTADPAAAVADGIAILYPREPIMAELRDALPSVEPATDQAHFRFPPTEVRHRRRA